MATYSDLIKQAGFQQFAQNTNNWVTNNIRKPVWNGLQTVGDAGMTGLNWVSNPIRNGFNKAVQVGSNFAAPIQSSVQPMWQKAKQFVAPVTNTVLPQKSAPREARPGRIVEGSW